MKEDFLKPDDAWEIFGVKDQDDFISKFLKKGKFHKDVPEKIIRDYEKVERLIFYSYFYYPLIDEAFGKSTRIFEASVNLKFEQLNLKSHKKFESLNSKIDKLQDYFSNELISQFKEVKELRNLFAHHKAGRLMGFAILRAFTHNINMINSIFLEKEEIEKMESSIEDLRKKSEGLKNGLYVLNGRDNYAYLIWAATPYTSWIKDSKLYSLWVFHPVIKADNVENFTQLPNPFFHELEDVQFKENSLTAIDGKTGNKISLKNTNNWAFLKDLDAHNDLSKKLKDADRHLYALQVKREIALGIAEFIYKYAW